MCWLLWTVQTTFPGLLQLLDKAHSIVPKTLESMEFFLGSSIKPSLSSDTKPSCTNLLFLYCISNSSTAKTSFEFLLLSPGNNHNFRSRNYEGFWKEQSATFSGIKSITSPEELEGMIWGYRM